MTRAYLTERSGEMSNPSPSGRRFSSATLALILAGLLALAAVSIAVLRSGDEAETAADPHAGLPEGQQPGSIDEMIASLRERLRQNPDDAQAWFLLGLAGREAGRVAEAGQAFRRAMELEPDNADYVASLGEAMLLGAEGEPPEEVHRLFRRALELQPGHPQARYYLATMKDMAGEHRHAVDELIALLEDAPPGAPWTEQVRSAVTVIAERNGIDVSGRLPPPPAAAAATAAIPGPTREQMESARAIPPGEQDAMVRGMVDRLATRLKQNPRDAEGWIRLMRSRMVLNEPQAAADALRSGLTAFEDQPATQQQLRAAAAELGVPAG